MVTALQRSQGFRVRTESMSDGGNRSVSLRRTGMGLVRIALTLVIVAAAVNSATGGVDEDGAKRSVKPVRLRHYFLRPHDVVLFLGNSITDNAAPEMAFLADDIANRYPTLASGDGKVTLIRAGIGGEQAFQGAKRLKALLEQHKPTVCVVGYGTCEVTFKNEASYVPAMKDIVKQLKEAGIAITIVSPPPPSPRNWKQSPWPASQFVEGIPPMVAKAGSIAEDEGVLFVDSYAAIKRVVERKHGELTVDGIHLNEAGYRAMADALQKAWGFGKPLAKAGTAR